MYSMICDILDTDHECYRDDVIFLMCEYFETVHNKHIIIIIVDI